MRKLALALCLTAASCLPAFAQTNINAMEYFLDADPGVGNGISIPVTAGPTQNVNININTTGLAIGFHVLVIRAKDQAGAWGIEDARTFYVASTAVAALGTLGAMEYYIDSDPGPGNGTAITITGAPNSVDLFPAIPTNSLTPGFHVLHLRARDTDGTWGIPDARPFYVVAGAVGAQATITQLEYFFDTEPGYGAGTPLAVTAGTQINLPALISSTTLPNGFHTISIRAKDNDGQWGFAETRTFYVDQFSQVSSLEYYIDTDPGEGSGTAVAVTTAGAIDQNFTIPTGAFSGGNHTLGIRAARTDGAWGNATTSSFTIKDTQTITFAALAAATFGDAPFALTGTTSSGLPLLYNSSDPLVATISGSTVTIVGAGTTTITASQTGDVSYAAATDAPQTLVVNKASQTITFGALAAKSVGDPPFSLGGTSSSSLGIVYSSSNPLVATVSGSTVTIVGAGTTNITASQTGNGNYNAATTVVQALVVQAVNNPPALTLSAASSFYLTTPVVIVNAIVVADGDGTLASATISITSGFQAAEDQLLYTAQSGITGTYSSSTGVLTMSGAASVANYETALRSVRYTNTATAPATGDRTISFRVSDGTNTSNTVTATVTINKPPAIAAPAKDTQAGGNIAFVISEVFSDPDNNLDLATLTVISSQGAAITISGGIITVNYSSLPDFKGTDQLTMTICDVGGQCQTELVAVDVGADVYVFNGISANGDSMNDFWRIKFLPSGSRVAIFNRWGDAVFESSDYDPNDPSKRFEGTSSDGNALAAGTYYYKVTQPDGREHTGYLYLKR